MFVLICMFFYMCCRLVARLVELSCVRLPCHQDRFGIALALMVPSCGSTETTFASTRFRFTRMDRFVFFFVRCLCLRKNLKVGLVDVNISIVASSFRALQQSSGNSFRVYWQNNVFPSNCNVGDCTLVATAFGDTCVCTPQVRCLCRVFAVRSCDFFFRVCQVSSAQVYTDLALLPPAIDIFNTLFIGAPKPSSFGAGIYVQCTLAACTSRSDIKIWFPANEVGRLTQNTIFELPPLRPGFKVSYVRNRISTISVGTFSFRNPPLFMPGAGEHRDVSREWNSVSRRF